MITDMKLKKIIAANKIDITFAATEEKPENIWLG